MNIEKVAKMKTCLPSKRVAIEVRGHKAVASIVNHELFCTVSVVSDGQTALTTCSHNMWRSKACELVLMIHHEYDCNKGDCTLV